MMNENLFGGKVVERYLLFLKINGCLSLVNIQRGFRSNNPYTISDYL